MKARRVGWAAWLLAAACLYYFENNTMTRALLAASILLPTISLLWAFRAAGRAVFELDAPDSLRGGHGDEGVCRVAGAGRFPGGAFTGRMEIVNPLAGEAAEETLAFSGGKAVFPLSGAHCGCLRMTLTQAEARDWFGLGRFPCRVGAARAATVFPAPRAVDTDLSEAGETRQPEPMAARRGEEPDDSRIRDYAPGDPVRRIHWKLSAKVDRLLVRESADEEEGGLLLMLETNPGDSAPDDMDAAAGGLLSLSGTLAARGVSHSVCWCDHGAEAMNWLNVEAEEDSNRVQEAVLQSASSIQAESVARIFRENHPQARPARVILFSPHPFTDISPLLPDSAVTLVLPEDIQPL